MKRALAFLAAAGITVTPASAQRVVAGAHFAFGDYREVSRALVYGATGIGGTLAVSWGRFGGDLEVAALEYEEDDGTLTPFKATQLDGRLRYRVYRGLSVEAGFTNRKSDDEFLGQSVGAIRLGAHAAVGLGPAAGATVRYNFLTGSKFSGGGSAGLGLEAGVGVFYGFANGRFRLTGAYDYQRFNRTIDTGGTDEDVPIQQVLARIGAAVSF